MTSYATLEVEDRPLPEGEGSIRILTINQPKALNALSEEVVADLTAVIEDTGQACFGGPLGSSPAAPKAAAVRGLLITGAGKAFVAGADITTMAGMTPEQAMVFSGRGHAFGELLTALPIPTLAAVNGFALGGGCELALACDFIYATTNAKLGQPEVKLGVIPGFGGTQRLLRRVGLSHALELCMTGDIIDAAEALRIGLVNRVLPPEELLPQSLATLHRIAAHGPLAVARVKDVLHRGAELPLPEANDLEQQAFAELFASADQKEGMAAFLGKRKASFTGR